MDSKNNLPIYSLITPREINWTAPRKYIGRTTEAHPGTVFPVKIDSSTNYSVINNEKQAMINPSIPITLKGTRENDVMPFSASAKLSLKPYFASPDILDWSEYLIVVDFNPRRGIIPLK